MDGGGHADGIFQPHYFDLSNSAHNSSRRRPPHCDDLARPLAVRIESAQTVNGHTEYTLRVQPADVAAASSPTPPGAHAPPPPPSASWLVHRRFNDFFALHQQLVRAGCSCADRLPALPPKRLFGRLSAACISERLIGLQRYLQAALAMNPILMSGLMARRFVDPDQQQQQQSVADAAIQNATLCLRTDGRFVLGAAMAGIGWRQRKTYFRVAPRQGADGRATRACSDYVKTGGRHVLVKTGSQSAAAFGAAQQAATTTTTTSGGDGTNGSTTTSSAPAAAVADDLCLSWTEYGPDKSIDERELQSVLKSLVAARHPYVQPLEYAQANDSGALVVRRFVAAGSVKDRLCGAQPRQPFQQKYGNQNGRAALPVGEVALYGRQVLEALRWLHERGLASGHVHAGNVVVSEGRARLLDVENWVLGVPAFYRPFYMQHSRIGTAEAVDVYSWAHLVFEMAIGFALQESVVGPRWAEQAGAEQAVPATLKSLLDSILSRDACRVGPPTIEQLTAHRFFAEYAPQYDKLHAALCADQKPTLKLSTTAKEQVRLAQQRCEQRLQNEQKATKNQKRLVKLQEMMSSEEEKKQKVARGQQKQQRAAAAAAAAASASADQTRQSRLRQQNSLQLSGGPPGAATSSAATGAGTSTIGRSESAHGGLVSPPSKSASPMSPPPAPQPPKAPPPPQPPTTSSTAPDRSPTERSALLGSIAGFNKSSLRRVE